MTINIHNLLHLPETVRKLGPLWAHSCFAFEAANGELLKLFHGSQAVEKQVRDYSNQNVDSVSFKWDTRTYRSSQIRNVQNFRGYFFFSNAVLFMLIRLSITSVQLTNSQQLLQKH